MKDMKDQRFGRLIVVSYHGKKGTHHQWKCVCDCGNEKVANAGNLRHGGTQSCGCLHRERVVAKNSTHGFTRGAKKHPIYLVWRSMRSRCENPNVKAYPNYGGRGISVCDRWRIGEDGKSGFECFLEDMGPKPSPKHSVERVRNNLPYSPSNCMWATKSAQARNRPNVYQVDVNGRTMTLKEAAEHYQIPRTTVLSRLRYGWALQDALSKPIDTRKGQHRREATRS